MFQKKTVGILLGILCIAMTLSLWSCGSDEKKNNNFTGTYKVASFGIEGLKENTFLMEIGDPEKSVASYEEFSKKIFDGKIYYSPRGFARAWKDIANAVLTVKADQTVELTTRFTDLGVKVGGTLKGDVLTFKVTEKPYSWLKDGVDFFNNAVSIHCIVAKDRMICKFDAHKILSKLIELGSKGADDQEKVNKAMEFLKKFEGGQFVLTFKSEK